jgi:hypothetical protein
MISTPLTHQIAEWLSAQLLAQDFDTIKAEIRCAKREGEEARAQAKREEEEEGILDIHGRSDSDLPLSDALLEAQDALNNATRAVNDMLYRKGYYIPAGEFVGRTKLLALLLTYDKDSFLKLVQNEINMRLAYKEAMDRWRPFIQSGPPWPDEAFDASEKETSAKARKWEFAQGQVNTFLWKHKLPKAPTDSTREPWLLALANGQPIGPTAERIEYPDEWKEIPAEPPPKPNADPSEPQPYRCAYTVDLFEKEPTP